MRWKNVDWFDSNFEPRLKSDLNAAGSRSIMRPRDHNGLAASYFSHETPAGVITGRHSRIAITYNLRRHGHSHVLLAGEVGQQWQ